MVFTLPNLLCAKNLAINDTAREKYSWFPDMFQHLQNVLPRISFSFFHSGLAYFQNLDNCFKKKKFFFHSTPKRANIASVFLRIYQKVWHKIGLNIYLMNEWLNVWHMSEWRNCSLKFTKLFLTFWFFLFSL